MEVRDTVKESSLEEGGLTEDVLISSIKIVSQKGFPFVDSEVSSLERAGLTKIGFNQGMASPNKLMETLSGLLVIMIP